MAAPPPAGERRSSASVAPADAPTAGRVSALSALPSGAQGASPQGGSVRSSTCAASVAWTECSEPDTGGSGLIGTLQDADGKCTATVTVRSPLGLVDFTQLHLVRELGACRPTAALACARRAAEAGAAAPCALRGHVAAVGSPAPPRRAGRGCFGVVELYEWAPETPHAGKARARAQPRAFRR
jgi:hypothetical protein